MDYKLKSTNGKVTFLLKAGTDFVKNEMSVSAAQHIIHTGKVTKSDREDYPICIDGKWYFDGEPMKEKAPADSEGKKGE